MNMDMVSSVFVAVLYSIMGAGIVYGLWEFYAQIKNRWLRGVTILVSYLLWLIGIALLVVCIGPAIVIHLITKEGKK